MKPYIPDSLPLDDLDFKLLLPKVARANALLARYDGLLQGIPNPAVMLSPLTTQEAVLSSKIEGTQATVDEVLAHEAGMEKTGEKSVDIQEILNYRLALRTASDHLTTYPIRLSFVCELHRMLMDSVRGQNKSPGEFRKDQNWIGTAGCTIEQASFVPPSPLAMKDSLNEWEAYIDSDDIDFLIQVAIVHAQFELIHPFKDGNGRIGRILIPLFLFQKKVLAQPMFYLSEYLEANRDEYYHRLQAISANQDWNGWIVYFLQAIIQQASSNAWRVRNIMDLYEKMKVQIQDITHSQYSVYLLDAIFDQPIFDVADMARELERKFNAHNATISGLFRQLRKAGVLIELRASRGRQAAVLCFPDLLEAAQSHGKE